jgi:predicted SAM-dependent methyltransferase
MDNRLRIYEQYYNIDIIDDIFKVKIDEKYSKNIVNLYWYSNPHILNIIYKICEDLISSDKKKKIIEIGPGNCPFKYANLFIGHNEKINNYIDIDIDKEKLPFPDNYIDFIYCRHVIEDIVDPEFALNEIFRTCKNGYIETPSPLIETSSNVDCYRNEKLTHMRGYMHHHSLIYSDIENNIIYILPKHFLIEHFDSDNEYYKNVINNYCVYWNNYFIWNEKRGKPTIINLMKNKELYNGSPDNFMKLLSDAIIISFKNTNYFINNYA